MKKIILFTTTALLLQASAAQGQILNKIKGRVGDVINKVERAGSTVTEPTRNGSLGRTVFGNSDEQAPAISNIIISKTRGGAPTSSFSINDNIYARFTLQKSFAQMLEDDGEAVPETLDVPVALIYVRYGAARGEHCIVRLNRQQIQSKTIELDILPAPGDSKTQYFISTAKTHLAQALARFEEPSAELPLGTQRFDLSFGPGDEFKGHFDFTVTNRKDLKAFKARVDGIQKDMNSAITADTRLPEIFSKPGGKNSDPALSLSNLKAMLDGDGFTVLKAVIENYGSSDYTIEKNDLGVPLYKITARPLWVAYKYEGNCYYTRYYFRREYQGGGKYGPLEIATTTADRTPIACQNIR